MAFYVWGRIVGPGGDFVGMTLRSACSGGYSLYSDDRDDRRIF